MCSSLLLFFAIKIAKSSIFTVNEEKIQQYVILFINIKNSLFYMRFIQGKLRIVTILVQKCSIDKKTFGTKITKIFNFKQKII